MVLGRQGRRKMETVQTQSIRLHNEKRLVKLLRRRGPLSRYEITQELGLSFGTASNLYRDLRDKGICWVEKKSRISGGRPAQLVSLNPDSRVGLVFDFTSPAVTVAVSNLENQLLFKTVCRSNPENGIPALADEIKMHTGEILSRFSLDLEKVMGGIAVVPAAVDYKRNLIFCHQYSWLNSVPLAKILSEKLKIPVWVENDANMGAVAVSGRTKRQYVVFLYIGESGLGLGVVEKGLLLTGDNGYAGEIGHIPLGDPEVRCHCGEYGCLEAHLTVPQLRKIRMETESGEKTKEVFARLVGTLVNLYDPEIIVVGCELTEMIRQMLPRAGKEISRRVPRNNLRTPILEVWGNLKELFIYGAAEVLFRYWLNLPVELLPTR